MLHPRLFLPAAGRLLRRLLVWSLIGIGGGGGSAARGDDEGQAFFEKRVRPILVTRCYECHSGAKNSGGLSLETRKGWQRGGESGPAITPGTPAESLLIEAINYRSLEMPPPDKGGKLTDAEIAILTEWITRGAPDPRDETTKIGGMNREDAAAWWSFQPLPPPEENPSSATIDAFIDARLAENGLAASPPADKRTLIRRATYDLTGLPPTPEEVAAFLADDSPDAFSRVVDRLLESPQYGVHWGRRWLDVVRYADTAGENTDRPLPHAWRYRNWVFDAFGRDLPFDQFARLQIAGDLLRTGSDRSQRNEGIIATGYLAIARRFGHDIDKDIHLTHEDVIDNLGKNFLGLTTGCARCHDHKYDAISARDYYALYGVFDSTRFAFPGCEPQGQPRDLIPLIPQAEVDALTNPWRERVAAREAEQKRREEIISPQRLKQLSGEEVHVLAHGQVGEGASVPLLRESGSPLRVTLRKEEVLQLSVSPNGNYGADSTLVEWTIEQAAGPDSEAGRWSVADLIATLAESNPQSKDDGAVWCFLQVCDGPSFLSQKKDAIDGRIELKAWSLNDAPSVFVNASDQPIPVWTTLPEKSFFVHPGPDRPVGVAWVCPQDGEYAIGGRVADAHPAGLDGVSFTLEHFANAEFGAALAEAGRIQATPLPDPGPEPVIPVAYAVTEGSPHNARLHERGDPEKPGEEVPRAWLEIFGGDRLPSDAGSGRKELAAWIVRNPLLARVMANRIWQWHFGEGIVRTPNDFGSRGERPTHLELLEWLAAQFAGSGYRVKTMHRLIMNSAAWQRDSRSDPAAVERDSGNRWLARYGRRRLTAEEIRDSLLAVAGQLELQPGEGHPFPPEKTWTFTQHTPFTAMYDSNKRSAFLMVQRQHRHPFLALFDGADPNASTPQRQTTTTPIQSLYFLNDPIFHAQAARVAERLLAEPENSSGANLAYRILFQREPTTDERNRAKRFLDAYPGSSEEKWAGLARVLLASNEFLYVD